VNRMKRTDTDHVEPESLLDLRTPFRELSRYDLVLGLIPVALLSSAIGASVTDLPSHVLMFAGAVVSLLAMIDALFVNPPRPGSAEERRGSAGTGGRRTG